MIQSHHLNKHEAWLVTGWLKAVKPDPTCPSFEAVTDPSMVPLVIALVMVREPAELPTMTAVVMLTIRHGNSHVKIRMDVEHRNNEI